MHIIWFNLYDVCMHACSVISVMYESLQPVDQRPPGSSVHGILQASIMQWVDMLSSRGSSPPRDQIRVPCIAGWFFTTEPVGKPIWSLSTGNTNLWNLYLEEDYFFLHQDVDKTEYSLCKTNKQTNKHEAVYLEFFYFSYVCMYVVQSLCHVQLFATPWTAAHQPPCTSPSPGACSNSCPLNKWCHLTISSSVIPFSSCLQSSPASASIMSQLFPSGGLFIRWSIGASASASVLPMNIQDWFPLGLTGWISLQSKRLSRVFSNTTLQKHQFFSTQPS